MRSYQNVVRGQYSSNRYLSYNAQATYVYDSRYIVSGNLSYMGNDNLHRENVMDYSQVVLWDGSYQKNLGLK